MAARQEFVLDNGTKFYIRRFDAFLALKVLGDIQKKFLGPIAQVVIDMNTQGLTDDQRAKTIQESLQTISTNLDGASLIELARKVLNPEFISVSIDNEPAEKLEEHLLNRATDSVFDVIALVVAVVRFNYDEVFTRGPSLFGMAQQTTEAIH